MAILTRNVPVLNFNLRNLVYTLLIIGFIVALFFIPELIRIGRRAGISIPTISRTERVPVREVEAPVPATSPLDDILNQLGSRGAERAAQPVPEAAPRPKTSADTFGEGGALSWENLRSDRAEAALNRAQTEAQNLLQLADKNNLALRQALFKFIAGVDFVMTDADRTMTAGEAATYLENLDIGVTQALLSTSAPRSQYLRWMEASLTPALRSSRSQIYKEQLLQPFNPKLKLVQVQLYQVNPPRGKATRPRTSVVMRGRIQGKDIKKAVLLRNGRFRQNVFFDQADDLGMRRFAVAHDPAWGTFTFRIWDKKDNIYEKSYRFYPKVQNYQRVNDAYQLPFQADQEDVRIDRLFGAAEKIAGGESQSRGFETF